MSGKGGSVTSTSTSCTTTLYPSCPIWVGLNQSSAPVFDGVLTVLTLGMEKFYHPWIPKHFHCQLQNDDGQNISTPLQHLSAVGSYIYINCHLPPADHWPMGKRNATVTVWFQKRLIVPFYGMFQDKRVELYVRWSSYRRVGTASTHVIVNGTLEINAEGLNVKRSYNLTFHEPGYSQTVRSTPKSSRLIVFPMPLWKKPKEVRTIIKTTLELSSTAVGVIPFTGKPGDNSFTYYLCLDGLQDGDESDVDCGGSCAIACGSNQKCQKFTDCLNLRCVKGLCAGLETCLDHYQAGSRTDGQYSIFNSADQQTQVTCLMTVDGGGWRTVNTQKVVNVGSRHAKKTVTFTMSDYGYDTTKFQFGDAYANIEFAGELDDTNTYIHTYFNNVRIGGNLRNGICNVNFAQLPSWPTKQTINAQSFDISGQPMGDVDANCGNSQPYGIFRFTLVRFKIVRKTT